MVHPSALQPPASNFQPPPARCIRAPDTPIIHAWTSIPALSLRILNNERLRRAHWGEYIDLRGALVLTSDAPMDDLNCIESLSTKRDLLDGLLDIGFALLRAYDRAPAVRLTPLDRPKGIEKSLRTRGLEVHRAQRRDGVSRRRRCAPSERGRRDQGRRCRRRAHIPRYRRARLAPSWMRTMLRRVILDSLSEPWHTFYIGVIDGQPAGTLHLLREGATAGIYAVATLPLTAPPRRTDRAARARHSRRTRRRL